MGHPFRCITNNPMLIDRGFTDLEYYETDVLELFRVVFQKVECRIPSSYASADRKHPAGISPPYKTVLMSGTAGPLIWNQ